MESSYQVFQNGFQFFFAKGQAQQLRAQYIFAAGDHLVIVESDPLC